MNTIILNEFSFPQSQETSLTDSNCFQISEELAVKMYTHMATLQTMDTIFYEAQRQGRISFYVTTIGEEAINIASAAALQLDDPVFPQVNERKPFSKHYYELVIHMHEFES